MHNCTFEFYIVLKWNFLLSDLSCAMCIALFCCKLPLDRGAQALQTLDTWAHTCITYQNIQLYNL